MSGSSSGSRDADRGEPARGRGLRRGHDGHCHRPDLDAHAARQVEPVRLDRKVEGEHASLA